MDMIQPAEMKNEYGFRDANEKEDILTLSLLNTIHPINESRLKQVIAWLSPVLTMFLCVGILYFGYKNNIGIGMIILPACILLVYVPGWKQNLERSLHSSGICHNPEKLGTHFLLGYGVCTEKKEISAGIRKCYEVRVRFQNGKILEHVLMVQEEFQQLKTGEHLVVATAASPEAEQYVGVLPSLYHNRLSKKMEQKPELNHMRPISEQERAGCVRYYQEMRKSLFGEQQKHRIKFFLIPSVIVAVISFAAGQVFFLDLAMVLAAGYLFMSLSDVWETHAVTKELRTANDLLVVDARVADKPMLESQKKNEKKTTKAIDFEDNMGSVVFRSLKFENRQMFEVGDEVLLVYHGKKEPLPCKRP